MELERPRMMELLYTPRSGLTKMMKENSITTEELIFLFNSNKITPAEIRMNAPLLNDKLLVLLLKHWISSTSLAAAGKAEDKDPTEEHRSVLETFPGRERSRSTQKMPQQLVA